MPSGTVMPPGGKQCRRERQACGSTFSGGMGQRAFLCPLISNFDKRYWGERGWRAAPCPAPLPPVSTETPAMAVLSGLWLRQTFCIEKIPAHVVSFLLLLASARTICGIKRHALMDREKKDEKRTKEEN